MSLLIESCLYLKRHRAKTRENELIISWSKQLHIRKGENAFLALYVSGKLPTYPSPKPTFRAKCWLKGGVSGQFLYQSNPSLSITKRLL